MKNDGHQILDRVYENAVFTDWKNFEKKVIGLEKIVASKFKTSPMMKLVGSTATRTVRKGHEDLDYAVAFDTEIDNDEFLDVVTNLSLDITRIKVNKKFGYLKVSGIYESADFVLVPTINPHGNVQTYVDDAFYHSFFINQRRQPNHAKNVILLKEFFDQIGVYKNVKGISCELMTLACGDFNNTLQQFVNNNSLRINLSPVDSEHQDLPLIVDYPFLGNRSFTDRLTREEYDKIREHAYNVLENPEVLLWK